MTAWDSTQEGVNLKNSWYVLRQTINVNLPAHRDSMSSLAVRTIKG